MIKIVPGNETFVRIVCDDWGIEAELADFFCFFAPGYKYMQKFKTGMFDGKIRLFNKQRKTIYKGLVDEIVKWAKNRDYPIEVDITLKNSTDITPEEVRRFVDSLDLRGKGQPLQIREYQYEAIHRAIKYNRQLLLSPTSSGKSLILYAYFRWQFAQGRQCTLIVPSTMLVEQMFSDFEDYSSANGFDVEESVGVLYSGKERVFTKPLIISTWQSCAAMVKNDRRAFDALRSRTECIGFDEAHTYKADVVKSVMEEFVAAKYRIGTTGTIDDAKINALTLTGLMGPIYKVITTKQLMDNGQIVRLEINALVLQYAEEMRKAYKGMDYKEEVKFLVGYAPRNQFIAKLASSIKGNTLILFNYVAHGKIISDEIAKVSDRTVHFIHGGVEVEERERIRILLDTSEDAIVVATSSLFSTGTNIPSLENVIFAIPSKSTIRIRQSIGRGLRLKSGKTLCRLFDIADDLSYKSYKNTTLNHLEERIAIYDKESFEWTMKKLPLR